MTDKIEGTPEAWESGKLGQDDAFVAKAGFSHEELDENLGLQMISIRLQKSLIENLKGFAVIHDMGYQPLIKCILQRWVDGEIKTLGIKEMNARLEAIEEEHEAKALPEEEYKEAM